MKRYVTFGEVMLRLKSPGRERLLQNPLLEATFGGGGSAYISSRQGATSAPRRSSRTAPGHPYPK
jgi:hypothetical protein